MRGREDEARAGQGARGGAAGGTSSRKPSKANGAAPDPEALDAALLHDILYGEADAGPVAPGAVANAEFLDALCPAKPAGESFWVTAFGGDPNGPDAKWRGWPVEEGHGPSELTVHNNYFAIATIETGGDEKASRRKERFGRLFVVPLDDVQGGLPLVPTYVLQTSPAKRQAAYRLREPIVDVKRADRLIREMVRSGRVEKVDPGGANVTRYVRLPVGCNTKASHVEANGGKAFETRLAEWHPDRAYTTEELAHGFGLDLDFINGRRQRPSAARGRQSAATGANTVITALRARGLYKSALRDGRHDITCPWLAEHTDAADSGSCYFEPSEEHPRGGFKCLHGHCGERHLKELCEALGIDEPAAHDKEGRLFVYLRRGVRDAIIDEVAGSFADNDEVFARSTLLSTPAKVKDAGLKSKIERSGDQTVILPYNPSRMLNTLSKCFCFLSWSGEEWQQAEPPFWLASGLIDDPRRWGPIRPLAGVTNIPLLMADGTVHDAPGYHPGTAMLYEPRGEVPPLPADCSRDEALAAVGRFGEWLRHYPFAEESHRSAVIAMALAALARHLFPVVPYLHIDSPKQGSGKTLIAESIGILATGVKPPTHGYPVDPEETRKLLTSCLLAGDRVILFDNAKDGRVIDDPTLGQVVLSEKHGDRLLKTNDRATLENLAVIIGTGNNNVLAGDLPRRALMPRITPDVERPEERVFPWKPTDRVAEARGALVRDGLTVLAAYLRAGRPGEEQLPTWGSFESFAMVRGALLWLGLPDPAGARARSQVSESEAAEEGIYTLLWKVCAARSKRAFTTRQVMEEGREHAQEIERLLKETNAESLGQFLQNRRGQVRCGGLCVDKTGRKHGGTVLWELRGEPAEQDEEGA